MLSKVLAALVATVALGFAGYTVVHDSSCSHSCSVSTQFAPVSIESPSCCDTPAPSCCSESPSVPSCDSVCPALKAAPAKDKTPDDDDQ